MDRRRNAVLALLSCASWLPCVACATSPSASDLGTADSDGGTKLPGADGGGGDGAATGDGGGDASPSVPAGRKRVFATSSQHAGDFGGVVGADGICRDAAVAAKLGGTFKAWLSDGSTSASARMAAVGPWSLVDGTLVFPLATVSSPVHDLDMDEHGQVGNKGLAWTGTASGGTATTETCSGWSSKATSGTSGYPHVITQWTDDATGGSPCSLTGRFYCFEQ